MSPQASVSNLYSTCSPPRRGVIASLEHATLHTPPAFFAMTMGTGITSILLHNFPYHTPGLQYLGTIVFVLNVVVFVLLLGASIARYTLWRGVWRTVVKHNVAGMSWGMLPMGGATIVNMVCFVCVPAWGERWAYIAYGLWWADVLASIASNFGMMWIMFTRQTHNITSLAPTWLLPIVATVVAAASGGVVADALSAYNPKLARGTLYVSWIVWGTGVPIALMIIALLIYRFAAGGPPAAPALASVFLPLGPCGQGSFGIVMLGVVARKLAYEHNTSMIPKLSGEAALRVADAIYGTCLITGLMLWGLALAWYILGATMFVEGVKKDPKILSVNSFTVGLWALTFPLGVWATSTIVIAQELESPVLRVVGASLAAQVGVHWLYVGAFTVWKMIRGELFAAPELANVNSTVVWKRGNSVRSRIEEGFGVDGAHCDKNDSTSTTYGASL